MAYVGCCGFECGVFGSAPLHVRTQAGSPSFSTTTIRSGIRSLRINATASTCQAISWLSGNVTRKVGRCYVKFTTLPSVDLQILGQRTTQNVGPGIQFKQSDSKLYARVDTTLGATGVSVTTGVWYLIDFDWNMDIAGADFCDGKVDGVALGQATATGVNNTSEEIVYGGDATGTFDIFFEDMVVSNTSGDYPIGAGHVDPFTCTSDGTHNVAGTNDFERSLTGTDILNATTDAYQLVDDIPIKALSPTEFINMKLPPNATDYVECIIGPGPGISTPTAGPRVIDCLAVVAQFDTGTGNMRVAINDNGTLGTVYTATGVAGIVAGKYVRAAFADPPSAASVWHAANDGTDGDIRDLRVRFGSPAALDVNPDQYFASFMVEMEFLDVSVTPEQRNWLRSQAVPHMRLSPNQIGRSW